MASLEEIRVERIKKLFTLIKMGIYSYPIENNRTNYINEVITQFKSLNKKKKALTIVGRIKAIRGQGAIIFLDIDDGTGSIQCLIKRGEMSSEKQKLFVEVVDIGDFVEMKGKLFFTKRKERTLLATDWSMLAKSFRPLPDKWHGLQDTEERFRRRYLDLIMSPQVKTRFITRSRLISEIRAYLNNLSYIEVETPMLQSSAGGANAEPFVTHHNALDVDLYLRIAPELYLKKLLIGGFSKVYEISRNFRNEGIDATHNPEFTMLEFYDSYSNATLQMKFVEKLTKDLVKIINRKYSIHYNESVIDFKKKFTVVSYLELIKRHALILEPSSADREAIRIKAEQFGIQVSSVDSREKILDNIYKKLCRPKLINPTFVIDYPKNALPLAKQKKENDELVDAFQLIIGGLEVAKGFSELNDPIEQKKRFASQEEYLKKGDREAQKFDEEFLEAMEYGMPPAGGVGVGIDRIVMLLTNTKNIREVILFPTLRPKQY